MLSRPAKFTLMVLVCLGLSGTVWAQGKITALEEFAKGADTTVVPAEKPTEKGPVEGKMSTPMAVKPAEKAASSTPADLSKSLSRAEDYYTKGLYEAARDEALKSHKRMEDLTRGDQDRLTLLMRKIDQALEKRKSSVMEKIERTLAGTKGTQERLSEADKALEAYRNEQEVKLQMNQQAARDHLKAGRALLYGEREYDKATDEFNAALRLDPNLTEARKQINIARALQGKKSALEREQYGSLLAQRSAEVQYNEQRYKNTMEVANKYYAEEKYAQALNEYRRAQTYLSALEAQQSEMKEDRQNLEASIKRTQEAYEQWQAKQKDLEAKESLAKMQESLARQKTEMEASKAEQFDRIMELVRNKEFEKATGIALEMLYQDPADRSARILLQNISRERHKFVMTKYKDQRERELLKVVEDTQERFIPYREIVNFPERKIWREIVDVRQPVNYPSKKKVLTKEEQQVYAALDQPIEIDFTDTPLPDVLAFFREVRGVNIALDRASLPEDLAPVTLKMKDVPLKTALKEILEPVNMAYAVEGNVIKVARKDKLEKYEVRVYDVRDLLLNFEDKIASNRNLSLASTTSGQNNNNTGDDDDDDDDDDGSEDIQARTESLARLISQTVRPESWLRVGVIGGPTRQTADDDDSSSRSSEEFGLGGETATADEGAGGAAARGRIIVRGGNPGDMVILQTPEVHGEVEELLRALRQSQTIQVQIDARFVTVSDDWLKDVGFNINTFQATPGAFTGGQSGQTNQGDDTTNATNHSQSATTTFFSPAVGSPTSIILPDGRIGVGLGQAQAVPFLGTGSSPNASEPYGMNMYFSIFDRFSLTGFFKALQSASESETLSSPRVTLTNAQRGYITVGTQTNYVASFSAEGDIATPEIQTIDDSISLDVRPVVSADRKYVYLELAPYVRTVIAIETFEFANQPTTTGDDSAQGVPVTTRVQLPIQAVQEIETTVMVPDRGVLTIGGLSTLSEVQTQNGTPLLSKIPILKRLFSNDRKTRARRNLLILVRPQIIMLEEEKNRQL